MKPPCDITGTFSPRGDSDLYRFEGSKGEIWWVEAFAERIGSMADPAILIQKVGAKGQRRRISRVETTCRTPVPGRGSIRSRSTRRCAGRCRRMACIRC